jgi:hypothetical protein
MTANAKLALFFDWFFFDTKNDNIMNIGEIFFFLLQNFLFFFQNLQCY